MKNNVLVCTNLTIEAKSGEGHVHTVENIANHEDQILTFITNRVNFEGEVCVHDPSHLTPAETNQPTGISFLQQSVSMDSLGKGSR